VNLLLHYLYRDAGNYKSHGEVVLSNPTSLSLHDIDLNIRYHLVQGMFFNAKSVGLPDLHFKEYTWDDELDHDWHEYVQVTYTDFLPTTPTSLSDLLEKLCDNKLKGW
jgi:hypothetical protein